MERKTTAFKKLLFLILMLLGIMMNAQVIYVDQAASGNEDGASWANAMTDLQSAINAATSVATPANPIQVWVKADTYFPTTTTTQTIFFEIKNNVEMYGGFVGTESSLSQRDFIRNETILSGNIGSKSDSTDNSDKILVASSNITNSALVDGFTFTGAHSFNAGGAVAMSGTAAELTINNCTFHGNYATVGSAITSYYVSNALSILNVYNSTFYHNGDIGTGSSAIYSSNALNVANCVFHDNTSFIGGAITGYRGSVSVVNSTFVDNKVGGGGGAGITVQSLSTFTLKNSIFWNNTGGSFYTSYGGGITFAISNNLTNADPLFVDYENRDFHISQCSPAVNMGNNAAIILSEDFDGNARTFGTFVDVGAYENQVNALFFSAIETQDISCNGQNNGIISANGGGGTGSVSYSIDGVNFSSGSTFENLAPGNYTLSLLDNGDGCLITSEITLSEPDALGISSLTSSGITCNGDEDGKVAVTVSGGSAPFRASFDGGSSFATPQFTDNTEIDELDAGSYQITIIDGNGCSYTHPTSIVITQPDDITASPVITSVACYGEATGGFTANASGGNAPLYYTIEGLSSDYLTSPTFENLEAGTYTLTVIDSKLCYEEFQVEIEEPLAELQLSVAQNNPAICEGQADGLLMVTATGGTSAYSYSIDGVNFSASNTFSDQAAGPYTVIVMDDNGCQASVSAIIENQLEVMANLNSSVNPTCPGGSDGGFEASASGGVSPYSYSIDGANFQSGDSFSDLSAGNYTVTVMDSEGCFGTTSVILTDPQAMDVDVTVSGVSCFEEQDGTIDISMNGGTPPYEYSLDGANFQSSTEFTGMSAGTYAVTVRDANGCETTEEATISEPAVLSTQASAGDVSCFEGEDGTIMVSVSGGTSPYEYSLDGSTFQSSTEFTGLSTDTYTVTVLDANGCMATDEVIVSEPTELELTVTQNDRKSFTLSATGGIAPYEYSADGTTFQASTSFSGLDPGNYVFTVRDANGCEATSTQVEVVLGVAKSNIFIYPNPTADVVRIKGVEFDSALVFNLEGRELIRSTSKIISVEGLSSGIHVIKLYKDGKEVHNQKIIVN